MRPEWANGKTNLLKDSKSVLPPSNDDLVIDPNSVDMHVEDVSCARARGV